MEAWETREWFQEFLESLNRHDPEAVREFLAPADAWLDDYADLVRGFPDWQWRRIQIVVEEDRLAVHLRGSGTHTGIFRHLPPTRRRVSIAAFAMYRVTRGRIVEASGTDDAEAIRAAVL
ncbi:MAG: ester cyclase [Microbacterium sp. SCN 71-17]|nr:MAG: ester cyclase [Microbacterium sp. SCN 71-17]